MTKPINRRQFLEKAGLAGATGLTMITNKGIIGAMFGVPIKTRINYDPKSFRTSGTTDAAIAIPTTRREFTKMVDKIGDYKSTVLAFTDLIIEKYRGRR